MQKNQKIKTQFSRSAKISQIESAILYIVPFILKGLLQLEITLRLKVVTKDYP
jgi:hypothetical protein